MKPILLMDRSIESRLELEESKGEKLGVGRRRNVLGFNGFGIAAGF